MEQARFQAVIQAVDQASGPLKAIRAQVQALRAPLSGLEGGFRRATEQFREMSRVSGLTRIADAARHAHGAFADLGAKVAGVLTPLGVLGGASSVAGLLHIVNRAAEAGGAMKDLYDRLNVVTDAQRANVAAFQYSAAQSGSSPEAAGAALARLNRTVAEARAGQNPEAMQLFQRARIKLAGPDGKPVTGVDLVPQIAALFEKNLDPGLRERLAKTLMGKTGGDLIPAVAGFRENAARFLKFGRVFGEDDVDSLDRYDDAWGDLRMSIKGVADAIGAQLSPVLAPLIEDFSRFIAANRELIATGVKEWVKDVRESLSQWDLKSMLADVSAFCATVRETVAAVGGWKTVMIGFSAVLAGPWIAAVASVVASMAGLAVAFAANPIAGAGLAAVGGAAYLVMQHWRPVKTFFEDLWRSVADAFSGAWASIRATVIDPLIAAAQRIAAAWQGLAPIIERFRALEGSGPRLPGEAMPRRGGLNGAGRLEAFPGIEPRPMRFNPAGGASGAGGQVTVRFVNAPPAMRVDTARGGAQPVRVAVGYAFGKSPVFA